MASSASDASGNAAMKSSWMTALPLAEMIPIQRPQPRRDQIPKAPTSWMTPTTSRIHPHVLSSATTNLASWTKNVDLSIAAMP